MSTMERVRAGLAFPQAGPHDLSRRRTLAGFALAVVAPGLLTVLLVWIPHHGGLALTVPLYLLATVIVSLVGGLVPAVVAAVVSSLLVNWFFTPPYGTLAIADPSNALAVGVFVAVAVIVALLVHTITRRTDAALAAQAEAAALAELTRGLLDSPDQLALLLDRAVAVFGVRGAALVRTRGGRPNAVIASAGDFDADALGASDREPADDRHDLVLQPAGLTADRRRLFSAYAVHAGAILRRRELEASASSAEELARDNRARTALLSAVSHDLRTPLAGIKAAIGSLRAEDVTWAPEDEAELKEAIEESADRLDALIGNLLDMSRLQAGALVAHPRDIDLGEVVPAIIHGMGQAERIRWSIAPEGRYASADPGLLDRVLGNVVENALRHHPADSPEPVRVDVGVRDGRVEIRVVDHGEGVPESQLDRIFRPFQRYGDHPQGEGTGLGLAIARGLAEAMGGTLLAETTPGGGLTLVLSLPLAGGSDAAGAARKEDR